MPHTSAQNAIAGARTRLARDWFGFALIASTIVAFGLRFYDLAHNPPELFEDELAGAASAWSIVTTGHDVGRTVLPFLTTRLELKQPLFGLSTVPFQAVLGHVVLAVRLPAVLFGTATVLLAAWCARMLGRSRGEQVIAAALMAILPWSVHLGRVGWEPASALPFVIGGVGLLWSGLDAGKPRRIITSAAILALGAYAYEPALLINVMLAAWLVGLSWVRLRPPPFRTLALGAGVAVLILAPYVIAARDPLFLQRASAISSFAHGLNPEDVGLAWTNYWAQWNPRWLFLEGTANLRNEPDMGVLFPWVAPFLVLGVFRLVQRRSTSDTLILGWAVLGPIPAALTNDGVPHFLRGIAALPAIVLASSTGLVFAWELLGRLRPTEVSRPLIAALVLALVAQETGAAALFYYRDYPAASADAWYYGTGEALTVARAVVPSGGRLCIETPSISYWSFPQYVAWYLDGVPFTVVEGTSDAACWIPGTYVLQHMDSAVPTGATTVETVPNYDGSPLFRLLRVAESP